MELLTKIPFAATECPCISTMRVPSLSSFLWSGDLATKFHHGMPNRKDLLVQTCYKRGTSERTQQFPSSCLAANAE